MKMDAEVWCDPGAYANEPTSLYGMLCMQRYTHLKFEKQTLNCMTFH